MVIGLSKHKKIEKSQSLERHVLRSQGMSIQDK